MSSPEESSTFKKKWVGQILGAASQSPSQDLDYYEVSTDTRTLSHGALFAAIQGEQFDGEKFIPQAIKSGAIGIICSETAFQKYQKDFDQIDFYVSASDTIDSLRLLAQSWLASMNATVIAVTGSVGKTTTKDLIATILRHNGFHVLSTERSENGFLGIAKTLLRLEASHTYAVIEIGIDDLGAMKKHLEIVQPNYCILTAIAEEHLHQLKDIETVAREELLSLTWTLDHGGTVFVNLTDPRIAKTDFRKNDPMRIITYGSRDSGAHYEVVAKKNKDTFDVSFGKNVSTFDSSLKGPHNLINQLGAIAVTHTLGLSPQIIREAIGGFKPSFGRTEIEDINGVQFVCDFYNANPASVNAALETVRELKPEDSKCWICLGDMLELGDYEEALHRSLAKPLSDHRVDGVFLFGPRMTKLLDELKTSGFGGKLVHSDDKVVLAKEIRRDLSAGDIVLLKGSRGMKMEELFEHLK